MRNVGRYPNHDRAVVHRKLDRDRLAEVSMTAAEIQSILAGRIGNHAVPSDVDAEVATKLTTSALTADVNNYVGTSEVGAANGYASLVGGKVVNSQMPTPIGIPRWLTHLEVSNNGIGHRSNPQTSASAYSSTAVSCGSFTVTDPGYAWLPFFYGSMEVQFLSGPPTAALKVRDSQNRIVAGGLSTRSGEQQYNRINFNPENLEIAYIGNVTFTMWLQFFPGSGQVRPTQWEGSVTVRQVPWVD